MCATIHHRKNDDEVFNLRNLSQQCANMHLGITAIRMMGHDSLHATVTSLIDVTMLEHGFKMAMSYRSNMR